MFKENLAITEMLTAIKNDKDFMHFKYSNEFILKWSCFINSIDESIRYYIESKDENCQAYLYEMPIGNHKLNFKFFIKCIDIFYRDYPNLVYEILFDNINNELYYENCKCYYTEIPKNEIKSTNMYSNLNQVYVIPFPQKEYMFMVIDGNHRVCGQIYEGKSKIKGLYIDFLFAAKALETPLQMCAYFINEDYWKIKYNMGKVNDSDIWKSTNIVNQKRYLKYLPLK